MKNKGFTLIEILSVIIILGIIMLIAVPSYTAYINSSRKSGFYTDITSYIESLKGTIIMNDYGTLPEVGEILVIPVMINGKENIKLEKSTNGKSPFGTYNSDKCYLVVVPRATKGGATDSVVYDYYAVFLDRKGYGVNNVASTRLSKTSVGRITNEAEVVSLKDISIGGKALIYDGINYIYCSGWSDRGNSYILTNGAVGCN